MKMESKLLEILALDTSDSEKVKLILVEVSSSSLVPLEDRKEAFRKKVWSWYFKNGKTLYSNKEVESFIDVWSSLSNDFKLMKFEKENKFQIAGRLKQFKTKQQDFSETRRLEQFKKRLGNFNPMR